MTNVTMKDVADRANVSIATVDRVLHDREGVSAKARQRVKEAIHALGFRRLPEKLTQRVRGRLRFLALLPKTDSAFIRQMLSDLQRAQHAMIDVELLLEIRRVDMTYGDELIEELNKADADKFQGVLAFAFDAPGVRAAIDETIDRGLPFVTLVSDVPSSRRQAFVGVDNTSAGRTAGRLMGKFLRGVSGEIGVITGNLHIRDHVERQTGFRQILGRDYRQLKILTPVEGDSIAARTRAIAIDFMRDHPRLVGLYSIGGGNSGVLAALREMSPVHKPVVIAHELTQDSRRALSEGLFDAVIAQETFKMARNALQSLVTLALDKGVTPDPDPVSIDIFLAENML